MRSGGCNDYRLLAGKISWLLVNSWPNIVLSIDWLPVVPWSQTICLPVCWLLWLLDDYCASIDVVSIRSTHLELLCQSCLLPPPIANAGDDDEDDDDDASDAHPYSYSDAVPCEVHVRVVGIALVVGRAIKVGVVFGTVAVVVAAIVDAVIIVAVAHCLLIDYYSNLIHLF